MKTEMSAIQVTLSPDLSAHSYDRRQLLRPMSLALAACVAVAHFEAAVQAAEGSAVLALVLVLFGVSTLIWAIGLLRRPSGALLSAGALLFGALALLWLVSRTVGLPLTGASRAPVGILDTATALDELALVLLTLLQVRHLGGGSAWAPLGFLAVSASCLVISMGCSIGASAASAGGFARAGTPLLCHLL